MTATEPNNFPSISAQILQAFFVARAKHQTHHQEWTNFSATLSGRFSLPVAMINLQRQGDLDLLLRSLEEEFSRNVTDSTLNFIAHYQLMLSESWITGCYEILRSFRQRDRDAIKQNREPSGLSECKNFESIFYDLELLRMPMAKYEIAQDRRMKQPLHLKAFPPNGNAPDEYIYDKSDPARSHIMQAAISPRGSCMWFAIDHLQLSERWIERLDLSERLLAFGKMIVPAGVLDAKQRTGHQ